MISGNYFEDEIILVDSLDLDGNNNNFKKIKRPGGIFNIKKAIGKEIECHLSFSASLKKNKFNNYHITQIDKKDNSTALIIIDKKKSTRLSFPNIGFSYLHKYNTNIKFNWHHISYLDLLPNYKISTLKKIKENTNIVSVDLCKNFHTPTEKRALLKKLNFVDFLITSNKEICSLFGTKFTFIALKRLKKLKIKYIIHSPNKIWIYDLINTKVIKNFFIKNLITLGAGDFFCGKIIQGMMNNMNIYESTYLAQQQTIKYLLKNQL